MVLSVYIFIYGKTSRKDHLNIKPLILKCSEDCIMAIWSCYTIIYKDILKARLEYKTKHTAHTEKEIKNRLLQNRNVYIPEK